jgi:tripartite ATP-independent transporter DctM subunit
LLGAGLALTWWWIVSRGEDAAVQKKQGAGDVLAAFKEGVWALFLPAIIIVGLRFGIFTPTEAAVVAAVYALFVAIAVYRELRPSRIFGVLASATRGTGVVMFLVAAWLITLAGPPGEVVRLLEPLMGSRTLLMLAVVAILFAVGCVMDLTPIILILTPVLLPVARQAGINEVYFGVIFVVRGSVGLITPPVGTVLNVVAGATRGSMARVVTGVAPFLLSHSIVLLLLVVFPQLVTIPGRWFGVF